MEATYDGMAGLGAAAKKPAPKKRPAGASGGAGAAISAGKRKRPAPARAGGGAAITAGKRPQPTARKPANTGGVNANYVFAGSKVHWVAAVLDARNTSLTTAIIGASTALILNAQLLAPQFINKLRAALQGRGYQVTALKFTGNVNAHVTVEAITPIDRANIADIQGDFVDVARQIGLAVSPSDNYIRVISKPEGVAGGSAERRTGNELDNGSAGVGAGAGAGDGNNTSFLEKLGIGSAGFGVGAAVALGLVVAAALKD